MVRDPKAHQRSIKRVAQCLIELGAAEIEMMESPITGAEGNHEFLLHARLTVKPSSVSPVSPAAEIH
ncbi:MAG TPA: hypothetical protein VIM62_12970 [Acidobacteriaceae bacterium]